MDESSSGVEAEPFLAPYYSVANERVGVNMRQWNDDIVKTQTAAYLVLTNYMSRGFSSFITPK